MFAIVLCKTYPKSSTFLYPHYYYTSPSHHQQPPSWWESCFHSLPTDPLSHKTADQSMSLLCLKSSFDLSSMAFRIMFQMMKSLTIWPPLHLVSSPTKFLVDSPSSVTGRAHSCSGPLHQLFLPSQIIPSPRPRMAGFFLSLRSPLRLSMTPMSCGL